MEMSNSMWSKLMWTNQTMQNVDISRTMAANAGVARSVANDNADILE